MALLMLIGIIVISSAGLLAMTFSMLGVRAIRAWSEPSQDF